MALKSPPTSELVMDNNQHQLEKLDKAIRTLSGSYEQFIIREIEKYRARRFPVPSPTEEPPERATPKPVPTKVPGKSAQPSQPSTERPVPADAEPVPQIADPKNPTDTAAIAVEKGSTIVAISALIYVYMVVVASVKAIALSTYHSPPTVQLVIASNCLAAGLLVWALFTEFRTRDIGILARGICIVLATAVLYTFRLLNEAVVM